MKIESILVVAAMCTFSCSSSHGVTIGDAHTEETVDADDPRPGDAPAAPDIPDLGETGWRSSTVPWCPDLVFPVFALDVWSSEDAVYILAVDNRDTGMTYEDINHIFRNDGTGWSVVYEQPARIEGDGDISSCFHQLRGSADGPIYLWQGPSNPCEMAWFEDGSISRTDFTPTEIFVVSEDRVWAMSTVGLMRWDGSYWVRDSLDGGPWHSHAWANEDVLFVSTDDGIVREFSDGAWRDHDTGTYHCLQVIWGFSRDDLWVSTGEELIHYNGATWTRVEWPRPSTLYGGIEHMWGADGILFLASTFQLMKYEGGDFTVLSDWQDENLAIQAIWGNSPMELFILVSDPDTTDAPCSKIRILRWDGTEFHWF